MKLTQFAEATHELAGVPFHRDPGGFVVTCIEITKEDIQRMRATGKLWIVAGPGIVTPLPIRVQTETPFKPLIDDEKNTSAKSPSDNQ